MLGDGQKLDEHALTKLRSELRSVDSELIGVLARRIRLVRKIGLQKRKLKMGVIDAVAEKLVMENILASAAETGVEKVYARRVAELLIEGSVDVQMQCRPPRASKDSLLKQFSEMMLKTEKKGRRLIRLDIGEPCFKTPAAAVREAKRCLSQSPTILYGSSAGLTELTDAIATQLNRQYGTRLARSNILIFPGARFAIFAAMRTAVSSLERVVICQPAWPPYESFIALVGARALSISTSLENGWDINLSTLEDELKLRPKMLVLNYPNNPTGKVLPEKRFREVMDLAKKYGAIVLSDEVYASYYRSSVPSVLQYPGIEAIYVNSFSKEFSMTGWGIAYAVGDERRIAKMRSIVETTITNVPEFVQRAALAALKDPSGEAARARGEIGRRLAMACEGLRKADFEFYVPEGGFYVFPRIKRRDMDSAKFAEYLFSKHRVGVLPGTIFGAYKSFVRLAVTESEAAVKTGIRRIAKARNEW